MKNHWSNFPEKRTEILAKIRASCKKRKDLKGNNYGFKKGQKAWNKGLTKETDERVNKQCESRMGYSDKGWLVKGYRYRSVGGKPMPEHHMKWIAANQCFIPPGHHIHHKDGNTLNNDPENLVCLSNSEHVKLHHIEGTMNPYGWRK